jgi:organic hydroperoxide reductase OsmC/OhrA
MLEREFKVHTKWSSLTENDTSKSRSNLKTHRTYIKNKEVLTISAAKEFKGDETKHNPEDLFLSALSSCHMMSYMYLCDKNNITILDYTDETSGLLIVNAD